MVGDTPRKPFFVGTMSKRPDREELLRLFFPPAPTSGAGVGFSTKGDAEAADELNLRACEAILVDLIGEFDKCFEEEGRGILIINLQIKDRQTHYYSLQDAERDYAAAYDNNEECAAIADMVQAIRDFNPARAALLAIVDYTKLQVFPVDREFPAKEIERMQAAARL
jgi:hypothetical protein